MTPDALLERLVEITREIEAHRAAVFLLKLERTELQGQLRLTGWTPPPLPEKR